MGNARKLEIRFAVFKDYFKNDLNFIDTYPVIYGTQAEAEATKMRLEAGQDKSWFDTAGEEQPFLYVDQIAV